MQWRRWARVLVAAAALGGLSSAVDAAPQDLEVGQIRATFARGGTLLREEPRALAKTSASLAYGSLVRVDRLQLPWIQVTAVGEGAANRTGWLKAADTVDPRALGGRDRIRAASSGTGGGVSTRDVSAAGRQLDAQTERGYRGAHPDLERAYPLVDRMEEASRAMDPAAIDAFIQEGRLGHPGRPGN